MKKPLKAMGILGIFLMSIHPYLICQENADDQKPADNRVALNMLLPPSSPGFTLLNREFESVDRPGTLTDFAVLIQSKTESFTKLPEDYAIEFSPYWIFWGKKATYDEYTSIKEKPLQNIIQSLSLSIASVTNPETAEGDSSFRSMGFGIKFSILRGKTQQSWDDEVRPLRKYHSKIIEKLVDLQKNDQKLGDLRHQLAASVHDIENVDKIRSDIEDRQKELLNELKQSKEYKELKELEKELVNEPFKRIGLKWDMAGGVAFDFPEDSFENASLSRLGIWTTLGYEWDTWSVLSVARYFHDQSGQEKDSYDLGGRLIWNKDRLSISGEGVLRFVNENAADSSTLWRLALISSYEVGPNKTLQFVFGRDYKGEKTGNLISMLNFIIGFGSSRPIYD